MDWNGENIAVEETEMAGSMVMGMGSAVVEGAGKGTAAGVEGEDMVVEEEEDGTVTAAEED